VGNLSLSTTEDDLMRAFVPFGKVISVTIMNDRNIGSGQSRISCYIQMASTLEGDTAIEKLQGVSLKGSKLNIVKALPVTHDPDGEFKGYERKLKSPSRAKHKTRRLR